MPPKNNSPQSDPIVSPALCNNPQFVALYTDQLQRLSANRLIHPSPTLLQIEERVAHYYAALKIYEQLGKDQTDPSSYRTLLLAHQRYIELYLSLQSDAVNPESIRDNILSSLLPVIQTVLNDYPDLLQELATQLSSLEN